MSRGVNVCVPVLRRYDLLREMLLSLNASTVVPEKVCIINNGGDGARLKLALEVTSLPLDILTPSKAMGVAESWNWFLQNVAEERVIVNDDVIFAPESIARLVASEADIAWGADPKGKSVGFSCFVMRDSCVEKIGLFDEAISPGYGYYEDEDYLQRLDGKATREPSARAEVVRCDVAHLTSATLKSYSNTEMQEHHKKFLIAQANYAKKWHLEEAFK